MKLPPLNEQSHFSIEISPSYGNWDWTLYGLNLLLRLIVWRNSFTIRLAIHLANQNQCQPIQTENIPKFQLQQLNIAQISNKATNPRRWSSSRCGLSSSTWFQIPPALENYPYPHWAALMIMGMYVVRQIKKIKYCYHFQSNHSLISSQ